MSDFLFKEFNPVSAKEWKQKIQYDLKGADYNDTLVWKNLEGIDVKPFYHQDDFKTEFLPIPGQPNTWNITQDIFIHDEEIANKIALNAIERGAEAIIFSAEKAFNIPNVFKNFPFQKTAIYFDFKFLDGNFINTLIDFLSGENANVNYNLDIIGKLTRTGNWFSNQKNDFVLINEILEKHPLQNLLSVDLALYQNAGANIVQQLAYALAHVNEYLNIFATEGKSGNLSITFKMAVGANYFFEIAKIRAFRKLFAILAKEYRVKTTCNILAVPSKRNKTLYDYNINLLRTTTECMSAVLGGANSVCSLPYDVLYHKSNEFGERIARNQLLILKNESYFSAVSNPSDGTYYIESITDEIAEKALDLFKEIEKSGGFIAKLKEGVVQRKISESAEKEQQLFNSGELKLLGTNYHTNPEDRMSHDLELFPFLKRNAIKTLIPPIVERRLAEKNEQERLKQEL